MCLCVLMSLCRASATSSTDLCMQYEDCLLFLWKQRVNSTSIYRNKDITWKLSFEKKTVDVLLLPPSGHLRVKHFARRNLVRCADRGRKAKFSIHFFPRID